MTWRSFTQAIHLAILCLLKFITLGVLGCMRKHADRHFGAVLDGEGSSCVFWSEAWLTIPVLIQLLSKQTNMPVCVECLDLHLNDQVFCLGHASLRQRSVMLPCQDMWQVRTNLGFMWQNALIWWLTQKAWQTCHSGNPQLWTECGSEWKPRDTSLHIKVGFEREKMLC